MKTHLILMIVSALTLSIAHAQVVTGGVSADNESLQSGVKAISEIQNHLLARDKICSPQKNNLKKSDIMDIYLKLSLLKGVKNPVEECNQIKKYLSCMNDIETKRLAGILYSNERAPGQLSVIYEIEEAEAKKMTKFFVYLED